MTFTYNGETYTAFPGSGLLAALGNANDHFGSKLPHPGAWMEKHEGKNGHKCYDFEWREGNFFD